MVSPNAAIEGLEIPAEHCPKGRESHDISATHDVFWAGPGGVELGAFPEEDRRRLEELGWHHDRNVNCWALYA